MEEKNYWVYTHTTPDGFVYVGYSSYDTTAQRWIQSHYKQNSTFGKEIRLWGWNNIEHNVIATNLSRESAIELEGELIDFCKVNGVSINEKRSGGVCDNYKWYYEQNKEWLNRWYRNKHKHDKVIKEIEKNDIPLF